MLERLVEERVHAADPGIADQDVEPLISGERHCNHGFNLVRPRDIRLDRGRAAAGRGDLVAHVDRMGLVGIGDDDGAALAGDPHRDGAAEPAPCPCDDRRLVGEAHDGCPLVRTGGRILRLRSRSLESYRYRWNLHFRRPRESARACTHLHWRWASFDFAQDEVNR